MPTGDVTLFGESKKNKCPICEELTLYGREVEIIEMEEAGQYFFPEHRMVIKYCPECGRALRSN